MREAKLYTYTVYVILYTCTDTYVYVCISQCICVYMRIRIHDILKECVLHVYVCICIRIHDVCARHAFRASSLAHSQELESSRRTPRVVKRNATHPTRREKK